jgi:hypothetical protein
VTGFSYRWDQFRAPVAGRYRVRFSGYTLWVPPGGIQMSFKGEQDKVGKPRPPNKNVGDYDRPQPGRNNEPITVYTRNGAMNRRVGEFDLTPTPAVHDIGEESVPILTELQDTVRVTNGEIGRLGQVTDEVAVLSKNAASLSENAAQVSGLLTHAVGTPVIKVASLAHGIKVGFTGGGSRPAELEQKG